LYWERYERAKLAAREAQRKAAKQREEADAAMVGAQAGADGEGHGEWQVRLGWLAGLGLTQQLQTTPATFEAVHAAAVLAC
jgi:hypothetical protein